MAGCASKTPAFLDRAIRDWTWPLWFNPRFANLTFVLPVKSDSFGGLITLIDFFQSTDKQMRTRVRALPGRNSLRQEGTWPEKGATNEIKNSRTADT